MTSLTHLLIMAGNTRKRKRGTCEQPDVKQLELKRPHVIIDEEEKDDQLIVYLRSEGFPPNVCQAFTGGCGSIIII